MFRRHTLAMAWLLGVGREGDLRLQLFSAQIKPRHLSHGFRHVCSSTVSFSILLWISPLWISLVSGEEPVLLIFNMDAGKNIQRIGSQNNKIISKAFQRTFQTPPLMSHLLPTMLMTVLF